MNLNRQDLQKISRMRQKESTVLIKAGFFSGAYYLIGYAVECALKACIAKQTKKYAFPNKEIANKAHVHNLENLLKLAGLEPDLNSIIKNNKIFEINWTILKDWSVSSRYNVSTSKSDTKDLYSACTSPKHGILNLIKTKW